MLHRLLQLRRGRETIPDIPAESASMATPAALHRTDDDRAPAAASTRPIQERLFNNTYQADADALLEQLEREPAALPSAQPQPPPTEPSFRSASESKSPPTRPSSPVSERTPLMHSSPPLQPAVTAPPSPAMSSGAPPPHTLTSPATRGEPGFRVTLSPMMQPMPASAAAIRPAIVPHHTTQLKPIRDSSDESGTNGEDASSDDDDDDDEEALTVQARSERKTAHDEAAVQVEKAAVATGLSPSALSPSPLSLEAHPLQETEKAHLQRLAELAQRQMQRQAQQAAHWRRDHLATSGSSDRFCVFVSATKWMLAIAAIVFICVALFFYFHDPHTSNAHMRRIRDGEHAAMSKHHKGIPAWPSRPQPKRPDEDEKRQHNEQRREDPMHPQATIEIDSSTKRLPPSNASKPTSTMASRLRLRLPLRTRG